jgi:transcriptional regulator with XRE-family HTH domain
MAETPLPGPTAEILAHALHVSGKTQSEVAREAGFARPNVISMMKTGRTKIPLDRIPLLAQSLGVDERRFLRIALEEYHPELALVIN